jgi:hypothetical protein
MARVIPTRLPAPDNPHPWRRWKHRRWSRPNTMPEPASLLAAIPSLPRATLARLTTAMIDRMDEIDGDPDLEDGHDHEGVHD